MICSHHTKAFAVHSLAYIRIYCRIKTIKTIEIQVESKNALHTHLKYRESCDISIYGTHASNFK